MYPEQHDALMKLRKQIDTNAREVVRLGPPIDRSDRETEIQDWLDQRGIAEPWEVAPRLVALGFTSEKLQRTGRCF